MTLFGDLILGTILTLIADKVGRRKVLLGGSVMMIISGTTFALFESFWLLLPAAVVGVISITGGDFGPFRSIEESILSQLTTPSTRSDVLAWYVTISTLGSAIGSEMAGRAVQSLRAKDGWTEVDAYHTLFWIYAATGCVNLSLTLLLSDACEMSVENDQYAQVPQDENDQVEVPSSNRNPMQHSKSQDVPFTRLVRARMWFTGRLTQISASTRSVMYKLWFLLIVDSLADGMVPFSLTNYYMDQKFHPSKATLGDITSASYFLGAFGATFAGPLARRIGLINTMVFTHVPSSTAVLLFPFPSVLWLTAGLVLLRTALNPMDQAPRTAFIAAVVKPEERTAVMGITSMLRTLASMAGPSVTGFLAANNQFWVAFVAAGIFRLAYDFGLYAMFVNMKVDQGTVKATIAHNDGASGRERDEEYELESPKFSLDSTSSTDSSIGEVRSGKVAERSSTG
ncbi:hypothetical protein LTS08_007340 [Lithohypha guttulata]|uniref:Major facilitator superfamily (MFS) profile domain-containing protein n=1 Tax=Lithohypha guttulata TaxID=1690604 RepID=A0AAN7T5C9_9EURO|nr:hypothetical protein LTR05_000266 [Lithohypha guttulata]KAK5096850.1 hypothetical protein LTS08_007340 [Lithohypha guttulata]